MGKLDTVTMKEITAIFQVTDRMGISREAIEIPLSTEHPGTVRPLPNGRFEIVVESDLPIEEWIHTMEEMLNRAVSESEGREEI